ncbi:Carbonic anhydrase 2 [Lamellibrachia satsuma]|nr:Carbonic anhydrase 2 [Lamellibrachia satsuma]
MGRLSLVVTLLLAQLLLDGVSGTDWSYTENGGPEEWGEHYEDCNLQHQSPIDIEVCETTHDTSLGALNMDGYDENQGNFVLKNNGHSVQVDTLGGDWTVTGGSLTDTYRLLQFHFHWGSEDDTGSEHTINEEQYPLEMHMVHMSTQYSDINNALQAANSLTVLGIMFEVRNGRISSQVQETYHYVLVGGGLVVTTRENFALPKFAIRDLMPSNLVDYYTYQGSLTTPPCSEVVIWNIFRKTVKISEEQVMMTTLLSIH